ncbi:universal stress protein [Hyperthermus butylicus]|uniref:Stress response protein n=1 Tax=Hyperthermus butylicus (strain DSM 5456 / JCM 9403 / PLM1-5) TaxID=415426 RepID=A2BKN9_HYPBU|nr:universal stress protein [Hyperthermus butylicus]ABM80550.1 Stress response protein [Hyperthermus butylicus DSM 5456]
MPYSCILVGYDGSNASRRAVNRAIEIAKALGSKLVIATVIPPPTVFLGELMVPEHIDMSMFEEQARKSLEALVREVREAAGLEHVKHVLLVGDQAEELVRYAEENGCDLIVVGRRGRGSLERLILGSVSSKVISLSHRVDVLVVEAHGEA